MNATQSPVVTVGSVTDTLCSQNCIFCCWRHWLHPARCAGLASDTPVVQSCQSVTRQSEKPRQYILCSPNTVNTEYISAPNTHVGLAHCIPTYSTNTKFWSATILAEYNSRIEAAAFFFPQNNRLNCTEFSNEHRPFFSYASSSTLYPCQ